MATNKQTQDVESNANIPKALRMFAFEDSPLADVDTTGMGGGDTPFVQTAALVGVPFVIHRIQHIETRFGPRWMFTITLFESANTQEYACTFSELSPVAAQVTRWHENAGETMMDAMLPMGPVTLERQGKSYRLASWGEQSA